MAKKPPFGMQCKKMQAENRNRNKHCHRKVFSILDGKKITFLNGLCICQISSFAIIENINSKFIAKSTELLGIYFVWITTGAEEKNEKTQIRVVFWLCRLG